MPVKHAKFGRVAILLAFLGIVHPSIAATTTTTPTNHHNSRPSAHTTGHRHKTPAHHIAHHTRVHHPVTANHTSSNSTHTTHIASHSHGHTHHHSKHHTTHALTPVAPTPVTPSAMNSITDNVSSANDQTDNTNNTSTLPTDTSPNNSSTGERLVSDVRHFISSLRYTHYKTGGGIFNSEKGIYELDCSHYVDNILARGAPAAYSDLVSSTGEPSPDSANYYSFISRLSTHLQADWDRVDNAKDLQPGDVLVFRYLNSRGTDAGGHVMLVMDKPVQDNDTLLVRVSDSAFAGHSDDTRPAHDSGVGIGTLVLKVDELTGQPFAYAWDIDSPWKNNVDIAMGRPVDVS